MWSSATKLPVHVAGNTARRDLDHVTLAASTDRDH
jgi:hypothetical protein